MNGLKMYDDIDLQKVQEDTTKYIGIYDGKNDVHSGYSLLCQIQLYLDRIIKIQIYHM